MAQRRCLQVRRTCSTLVLHACTVVRSITLLHACQAHGTVLTSAVLLQSDPCSEEPKVVGNCRAAIPRWSFIEKSGKCELFSYGGCGGTKNNFETEEECKKTCNVEEEPEPPVEEDCCPKGQFCCGTVCLADGTQTFAPCGPNECTCEDPEPEPCICTLEFAPLCNPKTGVTYGNRCEAVTCAGENPDDLVEGECKDQEPPADDDCCPEDQVSLL